MNSTNNTTANEPQLRKKWLRHSLMALGIVLVAGGGLWAWLTSGRYVGTDNAYIKAEKILLAPDVSGNVVAVLVKDNQPVHRGDELFRIDPAPYRIAADRAQADLSTSVLRINELKALYAQKQTDLERARVEAQFAERDLKRQLALIAKGSVSESQRDDAELRHDQSRKDVLKLQHEVTEILASLANKPDIAVAEHPLFIAAQTAVAKANLDLARTSVRAPADGIVGSAPSVGEYARAGLPLMNFIGTGQVWVEANFKETDLTDIKPGQTVSIHVDSYPGQTWTGKVESISPASGSEFSILPAQNSTGNWVKVVQRIAARISVDDGPPDLTLRAGMSTEVEIDTGRYPHLGQPPHVTQQPQQKQPPLATQQPDTLQDS